MTTFDSSLLGLYTRIGANASTNSGDSSLLATLYGGDTTSAPKSSGQPPVQALLSAQRGEAAGIKQTAQQADVKTTLAAFTKAVNSAPNLNQALHNPAVLNVLLTANGMKDQIGNTALAVKVLTSKLSDPHALPNVLTDTRWKTLAQTYNFAANGLSVLKNPKTLDAISQGYAQMTWEKKQDAATPGIADALTFIQQAKSITSVDAVLGNAAVRRVVTTALAVPQQIAFQTLNAQEQAISTRFDVRDLQKPAFVQSFAERFLIMKNLDASSSSSSPSNITTLTARFSGSGA